LPFEMVRMVLAAASNLALNGRRRNVQRASIWLSAAVQIGAKEPASSAKRNLDSSLMGLLALARTAP